MVRQVLIGYGSQAGCAESIAERLHETATSQGFSSVLAPLNDYYNKLTELRNFAAVVVVCSTTGNGDPPDNAERFYRKLRRRTNKPDMLEGVRFAVLGLGDTNYSQFCRMGKALDKRFADLGAERYHDLGCADDAVGLDQVVEPWIEGLWSPLKRVVHGDGGDAESSSSEADPGKAEGGGGEEPDPRPAAQEQGPASGKEGAGVRKEAAGLGSSVAKALANNPVEGVGPTPVEYPFATWESLPQVGQEGGVQRWEALLPSLKGVEDVKPLLTGRIMAPPPQPGCAIDVEEGAGDGIGVDTAAAEAGSVATAEQGRVADPLRSPGPAVPAPEGVGEEVRAEWARRRVDSVPSRSSRLEAVRQPTTALEGPGFSAEGAVPVEVDDAWYLTSRTSGERRVVHVELRVGDFGAKWSPGDSFGLFCPNPDAVVSATVAHLGLGDAERQRVVVRGEAPAGSPAARLQAVAGGSCSVADALRWHVDLVSLPRKKFLRLLADRCGDALDKARLLLLTHRGGREAFGSVVEGQRPTLPELLSLFPSCQPTLADLLAHGLQPSARFYSAASSPLADPQRVSLAFSVVAYSTDSGVKRLGVCTTWLERALWPRMRSHRQAVADHPPSAATGVWVRTFLKPSREFAPPADPQRPMVLIGPGTGVAPFRGFLEHREKILREQRSEVCAGVWRGEWEVEGLEEDDEFARPPQPGHAWLFFGCRRRDLDYLYEHDFREFHERGALDHVVTAFSREQAHKVYVQHRMKEPAIAREVAELIVSRDAHVYVCGDGARMATEVHQALVEVLAQRNGMGEEQARARLDEMASRQQYVRDIWS